MHGSLYKGKRRVVNKANDIKKHILGECMEYFIECNPRVDAYFNNMKLYENNILIRVRFLHKIFKAALDKNYTFEEHEMVLKMLVEDSLKCESQDYKILGLCFSYKIKKILNSNIEVPIIKSENTIMGTTYGDAEIPEEAKKILIERGITSTFKLAEAIKPDEEAMELYNVHIARDHFFY